MVLENMLFYQVGGIHPLWLANQEGLLVNTSKRRRLHGGSLAERFVE